MPDTEKFAILRRATRVWAVAAIHGEAGRIAGLHDELARRLVAGDRLVYLGNYFGHGREIIATVDEILRFRRWFIAQPLMFASDAAYLRGSQEEMWQKLLQLQFAVNPREVLDWMLAQGLGATLAAYGGTPARALAAARDGPRSITRWTSELRQAIALRAGHQPLLSALRRAAYTDDGRLLFVHAGLDPARPLSAQSDSLWWGSPAFARLEQPYEGFQLVVRGFDRAHSGLRSGAPLVGGPFTLTADGGCGFGGPLVAACLSAAGELVDQIAV
jgi:serine/threonine protein phosphatase 1